KRAVTLDSSANFFQRGKKPTTAQRAVAAKKTTASTTALQLERETVPTSGKAPKELTKQEEDGYSDELDYSAEESVSDHCDQEDHGEDGYGDAHAQDKNSIILGISEPKNVDVNAIASVEDIKNSRVIAKRSVKTASKESACVVPYVGDIHSGFSLLLFLEPLVHQADISEEEKKLRQFDLTSKYGPCTELTRTLQPPQAIKDMTIAHIYLNIPVYEGRV
ncbi:hypothetical protein BX616_004598, partial [Lobosporangium transversale]